MSKVISGQRIGVTGLIVMMADASQNLLVLYPFLNQLHASLFMSGMPGLCATDKMPYIMQQSTNH